MADDPSDRPAWPAGWSSYRPPPSIATAFPKPSLELRVSRPYGSNQYELLILDLVEEAGQVSRHSSLEAAQHFASERTGLSGIAWAVVAPERLTMRPEIGAESPLWNVDGDMMSLDEFPLDPSLRTAIEQWAETAWERDDAGVREEAQRFRTELARQLGGGYDVVLEEDPQT